MEFNKVFAEIDSERSAAEKAGRCFGKQNERSKALQRLETATARLSDLEENRAACHRYIEKCVKALNRPDSTCRRLITLGSGFEVKTQIETFDSELRQLVGVCEDVEIDGELDPGKAVLRRSQLLDALYVREGKNPLFLQLSEPQQLLLGNQIMREWAVRANPGDPKLGMREVIDLIDLGEKLSDRLGIDLEELACKSSILKVNRIKGKRLDALQCHTS
jgi:hypothetical protein